MHCPVRMGAESHRELKTWQLAHAIRRRVIELCRRPDVKTDFDFCDQSRRAARSACRNIAEGFARYHHPDFARFVIIAHASLGELRDGLDEALAKGYIDQAEFRDFDRSIESAMKAANGLRRYLQNTPTPKEHLKYGPRSRKKPTSREERT